MKYAELIVMKASRAYPDLISNCVIEAHVLANVSTTPNGDAVTSPLARAVWNGREEDIFSGQMMDILDLFYPVEGGRQDSQVYLVEYECENEKNVVITNVFPLSKTAIETLTLIASDGVDSEPEFVLW